MLPSNACPGTPRRSSCCERFDGLDRYLASVGGEAAQAKGRGRAQHAIKALLEEVFDEQTEFELRPERVQVALERLQDSDARQRRRAGARRELAWRDDRLRRSCR